MSSCDTQTVRDNVSALIGTSSRNLGLIQRWAVAASLVLLAFVFAFPAFAQDEAALRAPTSKAVEVLKSSAFFEGNAGQLGRDVLFSSHGLAYSIFFTRDTATLVFQKAAGSGDQPTPDAARVVHLRFIGATPDVEVTGIDKLPGESNYFGGSDPAHWFNHVPHFERIRYHQLYPGIDLVFYVRDGQLEYDFLVAPNARTDLIRWKAEGAATSLTPEGNVRVEIGDETKIVLKKPTVYQGGSEAHPIAVKYSLRRKELALVVGNYDHKRPLIIDPALIFSTYITSEINGFTDVIADIAADASGVYLTGTTSASSFPSTVTGPVPTNGNIRTYVVKLDPTGSQIIFMTFFDSSTAQSIAIDPTGAAYISGIATFPPQNGAGVFPTTQGTFNTPPSGASTPPGCPVLVGDSTYAPCNVPFATKLSPDGTSLQYSTLLQSFTSTLPTSTWQSVQPTKIAVDSSGNLYVTGTVTLNDVIPGSGSYTGTLLNAAPLLPFPTTVGAYDPTETSGGFVLKLNPSGTALVYSTYTPAGGAPGIGVDPTGAAYTISSTGVAKLSPDGSSLIYNVTSPAEQTVGLAVDSAGEAVVVGWTENSAPPLVNAFCQAANSNSVNAVVAKFNASATALVYSTTLCGSDAQANAVAVDASGAAYVTGITDVPTTFPLINPIEAYPLGLNNAFAAVVLQIDPLGNLIWSTFLGGGSGAPGSTGVNQYKIAVDPSGAVYVLIPPYQGTSVPVTSNALQPYPPYSNPHFLAKIAPSLGAPVSAVLTPAPVVFGSYTVGTSSTLWDVGLGNFGDAAMAPPTISATGDFSQTNTCSSGVPVGQRCDVDIFFTPTAVGTRTGTLTLTFGGNVAPETLGLTGTGTAPLVPSATLTPATLTFPAQALGTPSPPQQISIGNNGTGPLTITSLTTTGNFAETNACGAQITPGSTCLVKITFTPQSEGPLNGVLTVTDNASNSPQTVSLSGTGVPNMGLSVAAGGSASATVSAGSTANFMLSIGDTGFSGVAL